jgi:hypothetical protein
VITFAATGTYEFGFSTTDSGTTITIFDLNRPLLGSVESAVGYSTGTGGTVTQATDKSTGVTLNKRCGQITSQFHTDQQYYCSHRCGLGQHCVGCHSRCL